MKGAPWFTEHAFDLNDWFILGCIAVTYTCIYFMPKRLSRSTTLLLFLFSATSACMLDNSIGGHIFDLYDIMDGPAYTVMDFSLYFLYAPFGYFFIYFYDRLRIHGLKTIGYIFIWSLFALMFEMLCAQVGIFHYKDSYLVYYSFCIYLLFQSATVFFYQFITKIPIKE